MKFSGVAVADTDFWWVCPGARGKMDSAYFGLQKCRRQRIKQHSLKAIVFMG
jgi:hypothetical protein